MLRYLLVLFFFSSILIKAQYTDQLNSNRPGASLGAFAVGKGVDQFEGGIEFRNYQHDRYNLSTVNAKVAFLSVRWGLLFAKLALIIMKRNFKKNSKISYLNEKGFEFFYSSNLEIEKLNSERSQERKKMVSTGDRSAKIRTYNYPQGRITDHRINLTLYKLEEVLNGNLVEIISKLKVEDQKIQLLENSE